MQIKEIDQCGEISTAIKWIGAILSSIIVSLLSLVALVLLPISNDKFKQLFMAPLLSFAVGALVGDAILHLIPGSVLTVELIAKRLLVHIHTMKNQVLMKMNAHTW